MALYALISWLIFAPITITAILLIIMIDTRQDTLNQQLNFLNQRILLSVLRWGGQGLQSCRTSKTKMNWPIEGVIVGVTEDVNCNEFNSYDIVAKKNTPIWRRSVLESVREHLGHIIIPNVPHRKIKFNFFAWYYV